MARYLCFDEDGYCVQEGFCPEGQELNQRPDLTTVISDVSFFDAYLKNGIVKVKPEQTEENYYFDVATETWLPDIDAMTITALERRKILLLDSDWTQLPDVDVPNNQEWIQYRQHLRDVPNQTEFPINIDWGTSPDEE